MNDSLNRYSAGTRALHWSMALLFLLQFFKFGDRIDDGEHWIGQTLVPTHISLGVALLVLIVLRLGWVLYRHEQWPQRQGSVTLLAKIGHVLLYLCMVLMPVTGVLFIIGNGYGLRAFGVQLIEKTGTETGWMIALGSLHSPIAWLFLALVIGHIAAALFHQFVLKDNTLRRMLG